MRLRFCDTRRVGQRELSGRERDPRQAAAKEFVMPRTPNADIAISQMLLAWACHRMARVMAALKPRYSASEIATRVAGTGNPSGG